MRFSRGRVQIIRLRPVQRIVRHSRVDQCDRKTAGSDLGSNFDVTCETMLFIAMNDNIGADLIDRQLQTIGALGVQAGFDRGLFDEFANRSQRGQRSWNDCEACVCFHTIRRTISVSQHRENIWLFRHAVPLTVRPKGDGP